MWGANLNVAKVVYLFVVIMPYVTVEPFFFNEVKRFALKQSITEPTPPNTRPVA